MFAPHSVLQFPVTAIGASAAALPDHHPPSPLSQHLPNALPRTHSNTALFSQSSPLPTPLQTALETLDESGIGLDNIITLLEKLPTRDMRNSLVELYWKEIESVHPLPPNPTPSRLDKPSSLRAPSVL